MRHFKLIYLVLFYIPVSVKAAICFVDADNGVRYYRMKGDKTAYLSARADAIKPCNQEGLSFQPNQATAQCVKQALIACDPSFGALPVYGSDQLPVRTPYFYYINTQDSNGELHLLRYLNGQIYDASKIDKNGNLIDPRKACTVQGAN